MEAKQNQQQQQRQDSIKSENAGVTTARRSSGGEDVHDGDTSSPDCTVTMLPLDQTFHHSVEDKLK